MLLTNSHVSAKAKEPIIRTLWDVPFNEIYQDQIAWLFDIIDCYRFEAD